jgi:D-alanine-D-alanine ligase
VQKIVLVCDRIENRSNINILSTDLEFTSPQYFNALYTSAKALTEDVIVYENPSDLINNIQQHKNDIVFSAIWSGKLSRNRKALLPALCEAYNITYVGADTYVQSLSQDKNLSKIYADKFDICSPKGYIICNKQQLHLLELLKYPVVVKPNYEGSSIGISERNLVDTYEEASLLTQEILSLYGKILVEEYVPGIEVAICCVGTSEKINLCEVVALKIDGKSYFEHRIWGYESKKCSTVKVEREIITSNVNPTIIKKVQALFQSLGKVDYMRIDGRIYKDEFHLIELTPDCSLHPNCFMVASFKHNNYDYIDMLRVLIKTSIENFKYNPFPKN